MFSEWRRVGRYKTNGEEPQESGPAVRMASTECIVKARREISSLFEYRTHTEIKYRFRLARLFSKHACLAASSSNKNANELTVG